MLTDLIVASLWCLGENESHLMCNPVIVFLSVN